MPPPALSARALVGHRHARQTEFGIARLRGSVRLSVFGNCRRTAFAVQAMLDNGFGVDPFTDGVALPTALLRPPTA
jgi:hypothetical protein